LNQILQQNSEEFTVSVLSAHETEETNTP